MLKHKRPLSSPKKFLVLHFPNPSLWKRLACHWLLKGQIMNANSSKYFPVPPHSSSLSLHSQQANDWRLVNNKRCKIVHVPSKLSFRSKKSTNILYFVFVCLIRFPAQCPRYVHSRFFLVMCNVHDEDR